MTRNEPTSTGGQNEEQRTGGRQGPFYVLVPDRMAGDAVSVAAFLSAIFARKWIVLGLTLAGSVSALAASYLISPVYRSTVLMMPAEDPDSLAASTVARRFGSLASFAGIDLGATSASVDEAVASLRSEGFIASFVERNDLMKVLFSDRYDPERQVFRPGLLRKAPTLGDAHRKMLEDVLRIERPRDSTVIAMHVEWTDPVLARDWANALVRDLNHRLRQQGQDEARKSLEFLHRELAETSLEDVRRGIYQLMATQLNKEMLTSVREDYAFRVIDEARASHESDHVWPARGLFALLGAVLGMAVGLMAAVFTGDRARTGGAG